MALADYERSLGRGPVRPIQGVSQRDPLPRYRDPDTNITVIDVYRTINPNKTRLIPILPSNPSTDVIR